MLRSAIDRRDLGALVLRSLGSHVYVLCSLWVDYWEIWVISKGTAFWAWCGCVGPE